MSNALSFQSPSKKRKRNNNFEVIHISGASGSGKTTLGKKIAENNRFTVIDTDDIDDKNASNILNNPEYDPLFTEDNMHQFYTLKTELNKADVKNIIKCAKEQDKKLVFVGVSVNVPRAKYKYVIKTDTNTVYQNSLKRTFGYICANNTDITNVLNSNMSVYKKSAILHHKYKLRIPVPLDPEEVIWSVEHYNKLSKKGYIIMSPDGIFNHIMYIDT